MTPDLNLLVATSDLRAALSSSMVHAARRAEDVDRHQVLVTVSPEDVIVTATDGMSAGLAIASVHSNNSGVLGTFALIPDEASKLLAIFKSGKEPADEPQYILQLQLDDEDHLIVTDQSGLMPGRSLRIPIIPQAEQSDDSQRIDVIQSISDLHNAQPTMLATVGFPGPTLARFKVPHAAYHEPVEVSAVAESRPLLVRCGARFLGMIVPNSFGENEETERERWAQDWTSRLPAPSWERAS